MADRRKTREYLDEIIGFRSRNFVGAPRGALRRRRDEIRSSFEKAKSGPVELLKYFPVALIATIEWLFRASVAELIDYGPPYSDKAGVLQDRNVDIDTLAAIHGKRVSFGEIVSHLLPVSRIEHVDGCMSKLLGVPFKAILSNTKDRHAAELLGEEVSPIIKNVEDTYKFVEKTFELRHIYCHEVANNHAPNAEMIESCIYHSDQFLDAMDWCVNDIVAPDLSFTSVGMVAVEERAKQKAQAEMSELIRVITNENDSAVTSALIASQDAWTRYRDADALFYSAEYGVGSFSKVVYMAALRNLTEDRVKSLRVFRDNQFSNLV
jgi:uncharacterized protein YecT (DUF1311 family)